MTTIFIKRIYEPYDEADGTRILVDRIWPRHFQRESRINGHGLKTLPQQRTTQMVLP